MAFSWATGAGADSHPLPQASKLKLSEVLQRLPPDTVRVAPAERAAQIMARRIATLERIGQVASAQARRRRRWKRVSKEY